MGIYRKKLNMSTPAAGASTLTLNTDTLGIPLNEDFGAIQITVGGMDGGTWSLTALFGDGVVRALPSASGLAAAAIYILPETYVVEQIIITTAGMGGAAAPYAYTCLQGRTLRGVGPIGGEPGLAQP